MDLLVTSPGLLLGKPFYWDAMTFLTLYKKTNSPTFLPQLTMKHNLKETLLKVNNLSRKGPPTSTVIVIDGNTSTSNNNISHPTPIDTSDPFYDNLSWSLPDDWAMGQHLPE